MFHNHKHLTQPSLAGVRTVCTCQLVPKVTMKSSFLCLLLLALLLVAACVSAGPTGTCGANEHIPSCKPCVATCEEANQKMCATVCRPNDGCYCKQGFLRKDGRCILEADC